MVFQVSLDGNVPLHRRILGELLGSPVPIPAAVAPTNRPLEDFVAHLLSTESGKAILIPAAKHWPAGVEWSRADMTAKEGVDDASLQKYIRILGRPINSPSTNPTQIPVWANSSAGTYRLTDEVHAEVLRQLEKEKAAA